MVPDLICIILICFPNVLGDGAENGVRGLEDLVTGPPVAKGTPVVEVSGASYKAHFRKQNGKKSYRDMLLVV